MVRKANEALLDLEGSYTDIHVDHGYTNIKVENPIDIDVEEPMTTIQELE